MRNRLFGTSGIATNNLGLRRGDVLLSDLALPAFAAFGVGILLGVGITMLATPKTGRQLRDDLGRQARKLVGSMRGSISDRTLNGRQRSWDVNSQRGRT